MNSCVLDSSALLRFVDNGPGAARVEQLVREAELGRAQIIISAVNWGEVYYSIAHRYGDDQAIRLCLRLRALPLDIIAVDDLSAERAGRFRNKYSLPYADSFAASLAAERKAKLLTADFDFKGVADVVEVEFLPAKRH